MHITRVTTGTLVLIRLHKKANLLEMKIRGTKDRDLEIHADDYYDYYLIYGIGPQRINTEALPVQRCFSYTPKET